MLTLYHGSTVEVSAPRILRGESGRDFGFAFYTTELRSQAERWALRKALIARRSGQKNARAIVSRYEFDFDAAKSNLRCKIFGEPSLEWLDMVVRCRSNKNFNHGFDVVAGKVADDSVGETVSYVLAGVMPKEMALERLRFQKINSQIALCTDAALALLKFAGADIIQEGSGR